MSRPLTILVLCIDSIGRFNASVGLTGKLKKRGHRVVYLVPERYKEKLRSQGFEVIISENGNAKADEKNLGETLAKALLEKGIIGPVSTKKKMELCVDQFMLSPHAVQMTIAISEDFDKAVRQVTPDLVISDQSFLPPSVYYSEIPWIKMVSTNPLVEMYEENLPPGGSGTVMLQYESIIHSNSSLGYASDGSNRKEWASFNKIRSKFLYSKEYNDYVEKLGHKRYPNDLTQPNTQLMTVYAYPDELNYPQVRAQGWYNMQVFNKHAPKDSLEIEQIIPREFLKNSLNDRFSGKWIYLSLGSMCSVDVALMKRLVRLLGETRHKYVVSKGPRHAEFELASNMWGDRYVPQIPIVKFVDLVITHGGNNSTTEIFAQGKPMIVMPMFWDQFDNAQRVHETGFGIRLDAYRFTKEQLLDAITQLLYDHELKQKLQIASHRIQASDADEKICDHIETLLCNNN